MERNSVIHFNNTPFIRISIPVAAGITANIFFDFDSKYWIILLIIVCIKIFALWIFPVKWKWKLKALQGVVILMLLFFFGGIIQSLKIKKNTPNFSETDKDITKRAILGAGLPLLRLLSEPTAAGIAYGHFFHTLEEVILVFDMGAGTTDLTLMRKSLDQENNFYEVISLMGDVKFGGIDITNLLSKILSPEIDPEKAKINLSSNDIPELSQKKYFSMN
jgi:hypothetical protein